MWIRKQKLKEYLEDLEYQISDLQSDIHCLQRQVEYMTKFRLVENKCQRKEHIRP